MNLTHCQVGLIQAFLLKSTIPIFADQRGSRMLLGTGTLFKCAERFFLITARHIFDNVSDLSSLYCPAHPLHGQQATLGSSELYRPDEEHIDVAVIEFKCSEFVEELKRNWQFLTMRNVDLSTPFQNNDLFLVLGYPLALAECEQDLTRLKPVMFFTRRILNVPARAEQPVVDDLDLFFDYNKTAISADDKSIDTPKLPGVSGASVWRVHSVSGVWTAEAAVKMVAIQSAYRHPEYCRAKSWAAVRGLLVRNGCDFGQDGLGAPE
jgi:hypothetical protein